MAFRFALWLRALGVLLGVQFVLGIWLTLYGTFPSTRNVVKALLYRGDPVLTVHVALAVLLVILAFVIAVSAFLGETPPRLRWYTLGGFLAVLGAYEAGIQLIESGFTSNPDSIAMLLLFLVAVAFYGLAQLALRRAAKAVAPAPTDPGVA